AGSRGVSRATSYTRLVRISRSSVVSESPVILGATMKVLKFGGSSLATPERIRAGGRIVLDAARSDALVVVVSAVHRRTNQLLDCARTAERGDRAYATACRRLGARHLAAVDALVERRRRPRVRAEVDALIGELHDSLHGIYLLRHCPPRALDVVASF